MTSYLHVYITMNHRHHHQHHHIEKHCSLHPYLLISLRKKKQSWYPTHGLKVPTSSRIFQKALIKLVISFLRWSSVGKCGKIAPNLASPEATGNLAPARPCLVDGNQNPVNSPVEVGSWNSPSFNQGLGYIPSGCLGFLNHQQYQQT